MVHGNRAPRRARAQRDNETHRKRTRPRGAAHVAPPRVPPTMPGGCVQARSVSLCERACTPVAALRVSTALTAAQGRSTRFRSVAERHQCSAPATPSRPCPRIHGCARTQHALQCAQPHFSRMHARTHAATAQPTRPLRAPGRQRKREGKGGRRAADHRRIPRAAAPIAPVRGAAACIPRALRCGARGVCVPGARPHAWPRARALGRRASPPVARCPRSSPQKRAAQCAPCPYRDDAHPDRCVAVRRRRCAGACGRVD